MVRRSLFDYEGKKGKKTREFEETAGIYRSPSWMQRPKKVWMKSFLVKDVEV